MFILKYTNIITLKCDKFKKIISIIYVLTDIEF